MADLTVRILNEEDNPVEDVPVRLEFSELTRGMSDTERTNGEGYAYFSGYDEGPINVFVDHKNYGSFHYRDGGSIDIVR